MSGLSGADVGMIAAAASGILFSVAYAMMRNGRGDPLARLASWAMSSGLEYVVPETDGDLATFVGDLGGFRVHVTVTRVAVVRGLAQLLAKPGGIGA